MKRRRTAMLLLLGGLVVAGWLGHHAAAYPTPLIVTNSWALDYSLEAFGIHPVQLPGQDRPQLYWYLPYTIINKTGEDRNFIPDIWLLTDGGDLMQANKAIAPLVFTRLKQHIGNPLLERHTQIIGRLLQGRDHARDGVAIWPVPDHDVNRITVFFGGLSGETHLVRDPVTDQLRILRKTLMLEYLTPGDATHTGRKPFVLKKTDWIIR